MLPRTEDNITFYVFGDDSKDNFYENVIIHTRWGELQLTHTKSLNFCLQQSNAVILSAS